MRLFRSLIRCIGKVDVNNILEGTGCPLSANTIKVLSEVGFEHTPPERLQPERSALDRSAILTACRANVERVRARSGLYRSCSEIRPPSEAQRDALSATNPLALEWTFYLQAVQSYASLKYEWKSARKHGKYV